MMYRMTSFLSQASLETKSDISLPLSGDPVSIGSGGELVQMFIALGVIVFGIKFFLPKFILKITPNLKEKGISSLIIEESIPFAGGKLFVVQVHEKKLLLAATSQNINCLADLTSPPAQKDQLAFFEVLDATNKSSKPETDPVIQAVHPDIESLAQNVNSNEIKNVLDRMSRFTGT